MSEAKNKMSIIERIRSRIGESALYGGKAVCDSPCRFISLTKTRQALRLAFGTICVQIVAANSTKNTTGKGKIMKNTLRGIETCGQFSMIAGITRVTIKIANTFGGMPNVPTRQASLNSTLCGTLTPKDVNVMANLWKKVQRAAGNTARIITATNNKESSYGLTIGSRLNQIAEITRSSRVMTGYIKHAEITRSSRVMTNYIKHAEITRSSRVMTGYIMNVTFNGGYNA